MKPLHLLPLVLLGVCLHAQDLTTGLVAHFNLDGNALDSTGNGNNGTIIGTVTPTTDRFGNANSALSFDRNGYIDIGNMSLLNGATSAAITGWVINRMQPGEGGFVVGAGDSRAGQDPFTVKFDGSQFAEAVFDDASKGPSDPDRLVGVQGGIGGALPQDQWTSFVSQFSSADGQTTYQLYLDGQLVINTTYAYSAAIVFDQPMPVQIGALTGFSDGYFRGDIDDISFYDRTLTPADIAVFAVPEPATYTLTVGFGVLAIGIIRRRKLTR